MRMRLFIIMLSIVFAAAPAYAGEGLYLGFFIPLTVISSAGHSSADALYIDRLGSGEGLGISSGYRFTRRIALEGSLSATWHSVGQKTADNREIQNQRLTNAQLDVKYFFPPAETGLEPFISAGIGRFWLGDTGGTHYRGSGVKIGTGLALQFGGHIGFNAGLAYKRIFFDSGAWIGSSKVEANAVTLEIGSTFLF